MRLFTCLTTFQPQSRCPVTAAFSQTCLWGILQDLSNQTLRLGDSPFSPILTQSSPSGSSFSQLSGWPPPQNVKLRDGEQEGLVLKKQQLVALIFGNRQTKNVFTTVKPLFERWAVLPQPLALFFCVSQRDPEHVLEYSHPFSYVLPQERLDRKCWWEKQNVFCVRDHVNWCMHETSGCDGTKPVSCVNLRQCDIPAPLCCLCEPDLLLDVGNHLWPFPNVKYYRRNNSTGFQSSPSHLDSLHMAELRIDQRLESQFESESSYRYGICHCLFHHHQRLQTCKKSKIHHLLVFTKAGQVFCTSMHVFSSQSPSVMKEDKKISLIVSYLITRAENKTLSQCSRWRWEIINRWMRRELNWKQSSSIRNMTCRDLWIKPDVLTRAISFHSCQLMETFHGLNVLISWRFWTHTEKESNISEGQTPIW